MTGIPIPSPSGPPPGAMRGDIEAAMQEDPAMMEQGVQDTEIQQRIMRLEEVLISRGVLTEGDLTGEPGTDDQGQPIAPDPAAQGLPPEAAAQGAPPLPPQGVV